MRALSGEAPGEWQQEGEEDEDGNPDMWVWIEQQNESMDFVDDGAPVPDFEVTMPHRPRLK